MDIDKLIERLKNAAGGPDGIKMCQQAAAALSTRQAENEEMQKQLNEFSKFLCHMTGNLLSKTNYTAQAMISAAEDYQQRVCDNDCDLRTENRRLNELICSIPTTPDSGRTISEYDKEMSMCAYLDDLEADNKSLRADLARVTAERDAAISDLTCIARTYPVELCDDLVCQYCKHYPNINAGCPGWTDDDCFEWRGIKED